MTKFSDLKLDPKVLQAIAEAGYETPTPIQQGAIPPALEGRDVLGIAQTGTGKTASFTLPMITLLGRGRARARMPRSLVLCPTRELAAQVAENFDIYAKHTRLTKALLIGGVSFGEQDKLIDRGVDVLIATPGRLLDHFERGKLLLTGVQIMVVDEADRMLDMGFIPDIERIFQLTPFTRQTLFFSATMAPEIERITNTFLHSPERIEVARQATASETITQRLVELTPTRRDMAAKQKRDLLRALIDAEGEGLTNAIVFCNRKTDVDILAKSLAKHGYDAAPIHGDLDQSQRTRTLESFRDGRLRLLIASDVAARGLDIPAVSHVFNYDLPSHAEDYVHRIGRTGRAGRLGTAVSISTPSDEKYLTAIEDLLKKSLPRVDQPAGFGTGAPERPRDEDRGAARSDERRGGTRERSRRRRRDEDRPEPETEVAVKPEPRPETKAEPKPEPKAEQRPEPAKPEPRPEPPKPEPRERSDAPRSDRRRDGRRASGDGRGQPIVGMGDHVPQFMLVELRTTTTADEAEQPAAAEAPEPAEAPAKTAEKPKRRSRSRSRKPAADAVTEAPVEAADQPAPEAPADPAPEAAPEPTPQQTPEPAAETAEKPKRRSRSRTRKTADDTAEGQAEVPAEAQPAAEPDAVAEKPKRTRRKKAETEAPVDEAAEEAAPEKPKRTRRKTADAPEAETVKAETAEASEKPKRTRRKKADPEAEAAKDADAQA
ncbi:DEAD/DEAH box helicase [Paracoccus aestuarii]|uniref:DEAD-box ATP-dependent RNA helicase RhpA n=1 Tax=Paracoccus aestuarii TaxID=453842 RepID=A0A418ZSA5_9RHOB|nr:DEAD/DEAH box helicase [Paracoccus aestuarii]WCQ99663.1 DEAD/DEAH box helicase [Paracoccus aestuarii]